MFISNALKAIFGCFFVSPLMESLLVIEDKYAESSILCNMSLLFCVFVESSKKRYGINLRTK